MKIENVFLIGAGCPLADAIASHLSSQTNVIGVANRDFASEGYTHKIIADFMSESEIKGELVGCLDEMDSFAVVTCVGRFPVRKRLSDYTTDDDWATFQSNVLGFLVPYRATIARARQPDVIAAYLTFGSVSQPYHYPQLGVYTASKDALRSLVRTASHEEARYGVRFFHLNLSTLDQKKEVHYTSPETCKFLPCDSVAKNICHLLSGIEAAPFFSESHVYVYADSYYEKGYLSRIP